MKKKDKVKDLEERTFKFAVDVIKFLRTIKYSKENDVVKYQLAKSATSIGANYEEAQGAFSKEDFNYRVSICFRESKESNYWLRIIKATNMSKSAKLNYLIQESFELKSIFGSMQKKIHYRENY
ncbi:MAG: four helix bundle protein [Candidatus Cloacimonadota bacterium]|nr:MAG: four helix bundle protein [Candidatus Cloacimonadota bacterium]